MGSFGFPALQIRPPESPIQQLGGVIGLESAIQQQQIGKVQLEAAQRNETSRQTLMSLWAANKGDLNQTVADARASGQVTPDDIFNFQSKSIEAQVKASQLTGDQLANHAKVAELATNELDSLKGLPADQFGPALRDSVGRILQAGGPDTASWLVPVAQSLANDPSPENFQRAETQLMGEKWVTQKAREQLALTSAPTAAQAQAKTAAELDKAQVEAQSAHIALASLPTPDQAHTQQELNRVKTQTEIAASRAATQKTLVETSLLGTKPVIAFDPQTQQRVLTTMPQAQASKYTNPVSASEADIDKETSANRQFNDVQMNVSRYKNAINALASVGGQHDTEMAHILSAGQFEAGHLANLLPGASLAAEITNQKQIADDWNKLSSEEQDAVTGYLRAKGSIIAFQKALTQTGRTSKEALAIEMNNLPSPITASGPALKQMDAFQENIDTASKGLTRVPWLPSPQQIRQVIESEPSKTAQGQSLLQHAHDVLKQTPPTQATHIVPGTDGKLHYVKQNADGSVQDLGLAHEQ